MIAKLHSYFKLRKFIRYDRYNKKKKIFINIDQKLVKFK